MVQFGKQKNTKNEPKEPESSQKGTTTPQIPDYLKNIAKWLA